MHQDERKEIKKEQKRRNAVHLAVIFSPSGFTKMIFDFVYSLYLTGIFHGQSGIVNFEGLW